MSSTPDGSRVAPEDRIRDLDDLEERLSRPSDSVIDALQRLDGDVLVLGASGKMGPSLARMARRALDAAGSSRRVFGAARFADPGDQRRLRGWGIETIACDLLDPSAVERLPDAPLVVYLAGRKFGSQGRESLTWAVNCLAPAIVCRRFPASRFVALSTGNVYGLVAAGGPGSSEADPPNPDGEYAMSCLGRERVFEHFSRAFGTPTTLIRLNYAVEMRYGVLVDLAQQVAAGRPVDVTTGYVNILWQAHASAAVLQALEHAASPPMVLNLTGTERLRVRDIAQALGRWMGRNVGITGAEAPSALLSDSRRAWELFPPPEITPDTLIRWTADWIGRGGATLGKPTHFEVRDGRF